MPEFGLARSKHKKKILYISNKGESLNLLMSFHGISVESVHSIETLNVQLYSWKRWDLVLIESDLSWANPLETVQVIHEQLQIPVTRMMKRPAFELKNFMMLVFLIALEPPCLPAN
ncbi:MAG: hypothetical protein EBR01_06595 [Proteobacteria bacterium]|nr:hypothetical protein [Pseudomonadota bacterium]